MNADAARDALRATIQAEAAKSFAAMLPRLAGEHTRLQAEVVVLTEAQARFKPTAAGNAGPDDEGAWCIAEVLRHLIQSEESVANRIERLAAGREPEDKPSPGRLGGHEDSSLPELLEALERAHEALLGVVRGVDGGERLDAVLSHPYFGDLNCRAWLAMYSTVHLPAHIEQVAAVKASPGFPAG